MFYEGRRRESKGHVEDGKEGSDHIIGGWSILGEDPVGLD